MAFETPDIRAFRINEEFSIPVGQKLVYKFIVNTNTLLTSSSVEVDQGGVKYSVWSVAQTTETTPFSTPVAVYRRNLTNPPIYLAVNQVMKGGTANFSGTANTVLRVRTSSGNSGRASAVGKSESSRAFSPVVTYVEFSPLDGVNVTTTGVWELEFQEIGS